MKKISVIGIVIVLSIALMSMVGCAKEAETPTPTEFKTFSKYGFSFQYPKEFPVLEGGMLENEANDNSGIVQVGLEGAETELFQVAWVKTVEFPQLEAMLAGPFASMEAEEGSVTEKGELVETTKAGHRMLYRYYTFTSAQGDKVYGTLGVLMCDKSQKMFLLRTANNTISTKQDVLEDFQNYLDSFVCH